eukprot:CAMPEP_0115155690 /NCGR_PEP_ID=MMETSP0227-20121206/68034_1 /TAXON_ID=89957 /ORGANISM="Polarella glacialis, Strain CCMP 1383" /LENGTH=331 /DNA_ID=CAMNT_0002566793 /DNA_START=6 /DNA_END=1003 /DNA_ORIENTATION=+
MSASSKFVSAGARDKDEIVMYRDLMKDLIADAENASAQAVEGIADLGRRIQLAGTQLGPAWVTVGACLATVGACLEDSEPEPEPDSASRPGSRGGLEAQAAGRKSGDSKETSSVGGGPGAEAEPRARSNTVDSKETEMVWIARANKISLEICKQAVEFFTKHAPLNGALTKDQFADILIQITRRDCDELSQSWIDKVFQGADKDGEGDLSFGEFATWFSSVSFNVNTTLDHNERAFRNLCKKFSMSIVDCERYRQYFDEFDSDGSGAIGEGEFESLLRKCAKVPSHVEIPAKDFASFGRTAAEVREGAASRGDTHQEISPPLEGVRRRWER